MKSVHSIAEEGAKRKSGARHMRRREEALAKKSIPAIKKIIRRNKAKKK